MLIAESYLVVRDAVSITTFVLIRLSTRGNSTNPFLMLHRFLKLDPVNVKIFTHKNKICAGPCSFKNTIQSDCL